jgi:phenylalanyl-tRNA synthetase alpha chain
MSAEALARALSLRDLTDPSQGQHAIQILIQDVTRALERAWGVPTLLRRSSPVVTIADNYDHLGYPPDGAARDARYTRYVTAHTLLRTQTSAMIPPLLRELSGAPPGDTLIACPGLVYRRDCIDRLHVGEPHQLDLWRLKTEGARLTEGDLEEMIGAVLQALLPGARHRTIPAEHPYTQRGRQIDAEVNGSWVEIAECGMAAPWVLASAGVTSNATGLAMGIGLDRMLMIRKGLDDIRLLRSVDPRVADQMLDLSPYRKVSSQPPIRRDLSIAVEDSDASEDLGDRAREALGHRAASVEEVLLLSETPYLELPPIARERLGMSPTQKNVLVRVVIRDLDRTLTHAEANELRNIIYAAIHRGSEHAWAK